MSRHSNRLLPSSELSFRFFPGYFDSTLSQAVALRCGNPSYTIPLMKRTKSPAPKFPSRSRKSATTIDEYLATVPEPQRTTLQKVRAAIRAAAPREAAEIISYRIPAFKYKQVLVWFAAFADHCSLFPTAAVIEQFKSDLKPYKLSKGTIQFPASKPLPAALVKKMVRARLAHIDSKQKR
jgi:uncharacterized protein YdhG (YjbR/CyaY superfamily)